MEHAGITVETLDLSEVFGRIHRLADDEPRVKEKLANIGRYVNEGATPAASLLKMSKFGVVVDEWMSDNELAGTSVQCWTAMQEFFGVVPCTIMSMMSNNLLPSACETDMVGMIGMYALQLASETPSAIVDWNNNFGDDPDKSVIFHCSNLPKHFFENVRMDFQEIIAGSVGKENTFGTIVGRMKSGPLTFCRVSTDDLNGKMRAYVGEGEITPRPAQQLRRLRRSKNPRPPAPAALHLPQRLRTPRSSKHQQLRLCRSRSLCVYKNWEVHHHV